MDKIKRGYVNGRDVRLVYIDFGGSGDYVVLLHGLMSRATNWYEIALWLKESYHVIGFDQRGHGRSEKPDSDYSREIMIDDIANAMDELSIHNSIVIGHSMGASIAWGLAVKYPHFVKALIIEDKSAQSPEMEALEEWEKFFMSWPVPFSCLKEASLFFGNLHHTYADHFIELLEEKELGYYPIFKFEHLIKILSLRFGKSKWDELNLIQCPTLIIKGGESIFQREHAEKMSKMIKNCQFVEIPDAGHVVHDDQPELFRNTVEKFLTEL
ncbi:MAG: alpha/beta fold hydrolase [Candidatus Thorarchaeota archaeon]